MIFGPKTAQNCIIFNPLNLSPVMSPLRHRSVFGAKSAENGELRKVRFSCPASFVLPGPPNSLVFRRKPAPGVCSAPKSVFRPEKPRIPSLSPPTSPVSIARPHNTSLRRPTPKPCHSLPVPNGAFGLLGLTAMSRHRSLCAKGLEKRSRKSDFAPYQSRIGAHSRSTG